MKTEGTVYHRVYLKAYEEEREKESVRELESVRRISVSFEILRFDKLLREFIDFFMNTSIKRFASNF